VLRDVLGKWFIFATVCGRDGWERFWVREGVYIYNRVWSKNNKN
jgi:hypothetical protein